MNTNIIVLSATLLCCAACGSPNKKPNTGENSSADSVQIESDSAAAFSDVHEPHSERRENTVFSSDTLETLEFTPDAETDQLEKKTGVLRYAGNEPFVFPTLFESDSSAYRLIADKTFLTQTFRELNGNSVTLYGKIVEVDNSKVLEVHYYKKGIE